MKKSTCYLLIPLMLLAMSFVGAEVWYTLTLKEYACKIDFPGKPTQKKQKTSSAIGKLKLDMYLYQPVDPGKDDNQVYLFNYTEYPADQVNSSDTENIDVFFKNAIDGAVRTVDGKLLSQKDLSIGSYPGKEAKIDYQQGASVITLRLYLVKNSMYMLETMTVTKKDNNAAITKFMNSFKLTE